MMELAPNPHDSAKKQVENVFHKLHQYMTIFHFNSTSQLTNQ